MINSTLENVQASVKEVRVDAREATQKAIYLQLGVASLAYDAIKNAVENSQSFFNRAIDRGEGVETKARKEFGKFSKRAGERIDTIQTRAKSLVKRAENAVEENIEVVSDAVDNAEAKVKTAVKNAIPELEAPFASYDALTAKEVIAKLEGMSAKKLNDVKLYEVANDNRITIVREVNRLLSDK